MTAAASGVSNIPSLDDANVQTQVPTPSVQALTDSRYPHGSSDLTMPTHGVESISGPTHSSTGGRAQGEHEVTSDRGGLEGTVDAATAEQRSDLIARRKYRHRHRRRQNTPDSGASLYQAGASPAAALPPSPPPTSWPRPGPSASTSASITNPSASVLASSPDTSPSLETSSLPLFSESGTATNHEGRMQSAPRSSAPHPSTPSSKSEQISTAGQLSAETFDWLAPPDLKPFDVILACDVLYEDFSVDPLASLMPKLLSRGTHALILLADPVNRTPANRQRFLQILAAKGGGCAVNVEEACTVDFKSRGDLHTPVVLTSLRRRLGGDTVGVRVG